jgi:hypothetical protein
VQRYTADAATKTGQSERTIRREVARAEKIPDIVSVAGTSLDMTEQVGRISQTAQGGINSESQRKNASTVPASSTAFAAM